MSGKMRSLIENRQSRLRNYVGAPKRFLLKARDLYIDTMVNFDGKVGGSATHITPLPKNFARSSSTRQDADKEKDVDELYRSISKKCKVEFDTAKQYCPRMDRSYSIAIGKMGTIDEEEPCDFYENATAVKRSTEILFPRSTSLAVTRSSNVYY